MSPFVAAEAALTTIVVDTNGRPLLQVAMLNSNPTFHWFAYSTDLERVGKAVNHVVHCLNASGADVVAYVTQPGLMVDTPGAEQGDCDFSPIVDGKLGRVIGIGGRYQGVGPGILFDAADFWNIGSAGQPAKAVYTGDKS